MQATNTIPIVMAVSAYPEKIGLVQSLARPGGNVTGMSNIAPDLAGKRFELLKEIAPSVSQVAGLFNPANAVEPLAFREVLAVAPAAGVTIQPIEVRTPEEFPVSFAAVVSGRADGLMVFGNPLNFANRHLITEIAYRTRLAAIYEERHFAQAGGLISYAPSVSDLFRRAARHVEKVLKGAKPADLPVEQPTRLELIVNLRTTGRHDLHLQAQEWGEVP